MSEPCFDWSRSARRGAVIAVLLASLTTAAGPLIAQEAKPQTPPSAPISIEELNRDVRPRIRKLAEALFEDQKAREAWITKRIGPKVKEEGERESWQQAKLAREIAELDYKHYSEIVAPLEQATIEAEIRAAEAAIKTAEEDLRGLEAVAAKAKENEPASIYDVMSDYRLELALKSARLGPEKEKLGLEQARGKQEILERYNKMKQIKVLNAVVEKARSDELAKQQTLDLKQSSIASFKRGVEAVKKGATWSWGPVVKALDEAVGLEREIRAMLKQGPPADAKERAGWDEKLASQALRVRAEMGKAEQLYDDVVFESLARDIHSSAPRAKAGSPFERMKALSTEDRKALFGRLKALSTEDRKALPSATPAERDAILKKAGFTDSQIQQIEDMRTRK